MQLDGGPVIASQLAAAAPTQFQLMNDVWFSHILHGSRQLYIAIKSAVGSH